MSLEWSTVLSSLSMGNGMLVIRGIKWYQN